MTMVKGHGRARGLVVTAGDILVQSASRDSASSKMNTRVGL